MLVDGFEPERIREALEVETMAWEERHRAAAKVWEAAGGYAPTIGILGAVLGLIHVMENLSDPAKLGRGIAVAFVAHGVRRRHREPLFLPRGPQAEGTDRPPGAPPRDRRRRPARHRQRREPQADRGPSRGYLAVAMAVTRREEEHENHERWLVSYADFITLLFAFFVVMYAISTLNEGKYRVLSDALVMAFRHDRVVTAQSTGMAPINRTTAAHCRRRCVPGCRSIAQGAGAQAARSRQQDQGGARRRW
jgi:hypothetical protein